jgi:hypothetical protein
MTQKKYLQSPFDKLFIKAVNYLYKAGKLQQKQFAKEIDMPASNFNDVLAGGRGVPKSKIDFAKYILRERYHVRSEFLESGEGPILTKPLELNLNDHPQVADLIKENDNLKLRIQDLETRILDLKQLNETQLEYINSLKKQIKK